jgi:hypothetical protein
MRAYAKAFDRRVRREKLLTAKNTENPRKVREEELCNYGVLCALRETFAIFAV